MELTLFKWQKELVDKYFKDGSLALSAPTGTGKSILITAIVDRLLNEDNFAIIVTPSHLVDDIKNKIQEHTKHEDKIRILDKFNKGIDVCKVNIVSYNKWLLYNKEISKSLYGHKGVNIIFDEAHKLKSWRSKTTKATLKLTKEVKANIFLCSATLMTNSNLDLFIPAFLTNSALRQEYKSFWYFQQGNVKLERVYTNGGRKIEKPVKILEPAMDKYITPAITKVKAELKTKAEVVNIYTPISRALKAKVKALQARDGAEYDFSKLNALEANRVLNVLVNPASKLLQLANNFMYKEDTQEPIFFKYKEKLELLKSIVNTEAEAGHKGLVFYYFKAEKEQLEKHFKTKVYWHKKGKDIVKQIDEFEAGDYNIFVANSGAIGEGIRFKNTDYLVNFSINWNYGQRIQGNGRLNYAGRTKGYTLYNFHTSCKELQYIQNNITKVTKEAIEWISK